jgi:amidohydrolase
MALKSKSDISEVDLRPQIRRLHPELTALRRELHQHPEIRFEERWTSDRIAQYLTECDIPFTRGHAKGTGIVAELRGTGTRTIALRADMDALEIQEKTGLPYASKIPQRMHACGHDGHTACLLGTAKVLRQLKEKLNGTVRLIFQPAEEQAAGGRYMVEEGMLDGVEAVFALHNWPTLPCGKIVIGDGRIMASADWFRIDVFGKGGHGANPRACIDPVLTAAHITTALQSIITREVDPWDAALISVARIEAGCAPNITPEQAWMDGTFRALSAETREHLRSAIERVATNVAHAYRATVEITFGEAGYPPVVNDAVMAAFARNSIARHMGEDTVAVPTHPYMYAEDFAFYLEKVPGAFIFLGNDKPGTLTPPPLHSPYYDFNDEALPVGIEMFTNIVLDFLNTAKTQ